MVGAGDIGWCGLPGVAATARLIEGIPGTVFTLGDNAYMRGTGREFAECYEPYWGRFKDRTYPAPGNHEYETTAALPYYTYFGSSAGPPGRGYYSYELGSWHIISLNSEPEPRFPRAAHAAQMAWLRADLTENREKLCTAAYFHHPLYTSGPNSPQLHMRDVYELLTSSTSTSSWRRTIICTSASRHKMHMDGWIWRAGFGSSSSGPAARPPTRSRGARRTARRLRASLAC